jgi:hypothetical protein
MFTLIVLQSDSVGGGPKLIIINCAVIYRLKQKLAGMYLCRCGDNQVTEDVEIGFLLPGDTGTTCCCM